jgi:hypothetical protein
MYPGGTVVLASIYFYGSSASKVALIKKTKKIIGDGSGKISLVASVTLHHNLSILTTFKQ